VLFQLYLLIISEVRAHLTHSINRYLGLRVGLGAVDKGNSLLPLTGTQPRFLRLQASSLLIF